MKKLIATAAAVALMGVAAPAFAQNLDGSIGYSMVNATDVDLGALTARLSWTSSSIFGVEGEAQFGISDDSITDAGPPPITVDLGLEYAYAIYGTAGVPVGDNGRVFARLGYGSQSFEASSSGISVSESDQSFNYGVGAQFFLADGKNGVRVDYTVHDFNDGGDADVWSIAYVRRFK